ncbi:MAG: lysophospholipid acyltransferase family protein [Acidobacteria bacterium]|nr:lysophospholipid acyltransferase family protein [Acidobacteriota bacterium]
MHERPQTPPAVTPEGRYTEPVRGLRVPAPPLPPAEAAAGVKEFFAHGDLGAYTRKQRIAIRAMTFGYWALISVLGPTLRWTMHGREHLESIYESGKLPIYCFWHNRILATTWFWRDRGIVVMTSRSFDGESIARCIQRFGYGASRGSSTRGAVGALIGLNRALAAGYEVSFTVDGPKGPMYEVKPGPAAAARRSGNPILPVSLALSRRWEIGSWDRFQIPKPFSRAVVSVAAPIYVDRDADDEGLERARAELQSSLEQLRRKYD